MKTLDHTLTIATLADVEELSQLLSLLMSQEADFTPNLAAHQRGLKYIIQSPESGLILKLERQGKIIGMINLLFSISTAIGERVAILEDFIITPELRGQGYGRYLFREALSKAREAGCQRVSLLTDNDNDAAQHFYRSEGFSLSAMVPFRKEL